jgi:hypothetical protein
LQNPGSGEFSATALVLLLLFPLNEGKEAPLKMSGKPWLRIALTALIMLPAHASAWTSTLEDGGTVTVDPDTNRATVNRNGVVTPLWDGAHRMQDGSSLITNHGIAVPNESIIESRRPPPPKTEEWQDVNIVGYSPCEQLVRQVCGQQDQCADVEACDLARQLLEMETQERNDSSNRNLMTYTSGQCLKAIRDKVNFAICQRPNSDENK